MPLLLYCIVEPQATLAPPSIGVRGAPVERTETASLRCYYSVVDSAAGTTDEIKRDALEFHRVTSELFRHAALIPFRFPTTLASMAELDAYMRNHAAQFQEALQQFRDTVQMELRIGLVEPAATPASSSGAKYLRERAERARDVEKAIAACRVAINEEVIDWRQRESSHGVRCFALIRRDAAARFQQQIKTVRLHQAVTVALSGPWPPTEFLPVFA
jgi:hypothetical protein